jgi:hypothetical protein
MDKRDFFMRKIFTFLFIAIALNTQAQDQILSISKTYFRTHPFDSKFSTFILNLQRDPWFIIEEYNRRTDSAFFFLKGSYANFNPFRFKPTRLTLILAEEEIAYTDSLHTRDTIMNLQLIGMINSNMAINKSIEKEFKRFHQSYAGRFDDFTLRTLKSAEKVTGEIYNYFISPFSISPVTIAWGILPDLNQYSFTIIIRFKVAQNMAAYISHPGQ